MQQNASSLAAPLRRAAHALHAALPSWLLRLSRAGRAAPPPNGTNSGDAPLAPAATSRGDKVAPLALALQGGGAHGAFTWGVLDRLLEEPRLAIAGISGTSAGALNAAALASGYLAGGADGARRTLEALWRRVARLAHLSPAHMTPLERLVSGWNADGSASHLLFDLVSRVVSPYQFNPFGLNPLRKILVELIDFEALKRPDAIRLFVTATNLHDGGQRIFTNGELSADVLLASACLPTLHRAITLPDGDYWDGGFSANPPLLPLAEHCEVRDILLVYLNPMNEPTVPVTARSIQSRLNRIIFNAPLKRELEALAWARRMIDESGAGDSRLGRRIAELRLHPIGDDALMRELGTASSLDPNWRLVSHLHKAGRDAAERWLAEDAGKSPASSSGLAALDRLSV